jgi:large subunit ribosomal protein L3
MAKGILGTKIGMTQVFNDAGKLVPVTVVQCEPNVVIQKKTVESDGYKAVQLGYKEKRLNLVNKPAQARFKKADTTPKRYIKEISGNELGLFEVGQEINVNIFSEGEAVDVTATSKGKGFAGSIKRHNQHRGPMSHGSRYHRSPGSMGSIDPNHVRPVKNLPGHMGAETVTIQNLEIVKIDVENNLLLIKGNVPGPRKGLVVIKNAVKLNEILEPLNPADYITKTLAEEPVEETNEAAPLEVEEAPIEETQEEAPVEENATEEPAELEQDETSSAEEAQ